MSSSPDALLERVADVAREQARAEARTVLAMLEFAEARRPAYEASGPSPYRANASPPNQPRLAAML